MLLPQTQPAVGDATTTPEAVPGEQAEVVTSPDGLSHAEVAARRAAGQGNDFRPATSRTFLQILRQHTLSFINLVLFALGITLVVMGRIDDAILTAGMVLLNVVVGVGQETRAKFKLDQIALLNRPKATVIREGQE